MPHTRRTWRPFALDRHRLRHNSQCWKGWAFQSRWLLWGSNSKRWCSHCGWASNFWQHPDVFWRQPAWPFCWAWHWRGTHHHIRSVAGVRYLDVLSLLVNIPGGTMLSGRYVIVQMDNGATTPINLNEVKAFGRLADAGEMKQKVHDLSNLISRSFANLQTPAPFSTTLHWNVVYELWWIAFAYFLGPNIALIMPRARVGHARAPNCQSCQKLSNCQNLKSNQKLSKKIIFLS